MICKNGFDFADHGVRVIRVETASWLCLEIPGRDNVLRPFCFLYEMEPDVHVVFLGEPGFANQFGMNS